MYCLTAPDLRTHRTPPYSFHHFTAQTPTCLAARLGAITRPNVSTPKKKTYSALTSVRDEGGADSVHQGAVSQMSHAHKHPPDVTEWTESHCLRRHVSISPTPVLTLINVSASGFRGLVQSSYQRSLSTVSYWCGGGTFVFADPRCQRDPRRSRAVMKQYFRVVCGPRKQRLDRPLMCPRWLESIHSRQTTRAGFAVLHFSRLFDNVGDHKEAVYDTELLGPVRGLFKAQIGFLTYLGRVASINLS